MLTRPAALLAIALCSACSLHAADTLSIVFTGDVLLDRGIRPMVEHQGAEALFTGVQTTFRRADAVVINLECPLTDRKTPLSKRFVFRADAACADGLRRAGVTHAAMANNHTNDQGRNGLADTYHNLRRAGIIPLGYGTTRTEQLTPTLLRKGDVCVALFNAVLFPLENWQHAEGKPGICQVTETTLAQAIRTYRRQHPSHRIVTVLHWGAEFQRVPHITQRRQARLLTDAGADAIVGHHPHVIQSRDTVNGKPVFYSIGNFVFDQTHPDARKALLVTLRFVAEGMAEVHADAVQIKRCKPYITTQ